MFYNDPILYGATLPYKDVQLPFMGMNPYEVYPKFIPPTFGFTPFNLPITPYLPNVNYNPFVQQFVPPYAQQQFVPPYAQQQFVPPYMQQQFVPFHQPFNPIATKLPYYGWQRPITY